MFDSELEVRRDRVLYSHSRFEEGVGFPFSSICKMGRLCGVDL